MGRSIPSTHIQNYFVIFVPLAVPQPSHAHSGSIICTFV